MSARVERQVVDCIECLSSGASPLVEQVMRHEVKIDELERSVDALAGQIIARRKPTARDLRLVLAFIKSTTDLERIADEAKKIALRSRSIAADRWPTRPCAATTCGTPRRSPPRSRVSGARRPPCSCHKRRLESADVPTE